MSSKVNGINQIIKNGNVIVAYMMEECTWCEKLKPIWKQIKKTNPSKIKDITVTRNNPTILEGLDCDTTDTNKGFPCICAYNNGKKSECFKGERSLENLKNFVKIQSTKKFMKYRIGQIAGTAIGCAFSGNIFGNSY